jgi:hypothetical protein
MNPDEAQVGDIAVELMHGGFWTRAHSMRYEQKDIIRHFYFFMKLIFQKNQWLVLLY